MLRFSLRNISLAAFFVFPFSGNSQNLDIDLLHSIHKGNTSSWDNTNKFVTQTMTPVSIAAPAGLLCYGIIAKDSAATRNAIYMGVTIGVSSALMVGLKWSINRPRPFETYPLLITQKSEAGSPSFPSGHTSASFSTATSLSIAYPKWYVIAPSFLWATWVGYSRMELGVHYPSDVLAGALLGSGSAWLMWKVNKRWRKGLRAKG